MDAFDFEDYKEFIRAKIVEKTKTGYQGELADAAGCQKSYFSQVLNSSSHLTLEQAMRLVLFWRLTAAESDWFLETVSLARAQFEPLRRKIGERLNGMRAARENLAARYQRPQIVRAEIEAQYYSSWHWAALHIITSIPAFRKVEKIAERLNLSEAFVKESLERLRLMGLVEKRADGWQIVPGGLHLPSESPVMGSFHLHWRQRAVLDSQTSTGDNLHYTDVASHSIADYQAFKSRLHKLIDEWRGKVKSSKEEELSCLCLDFFRV